MVSLAAEAEAALALAAEVSGTPAALVAFVAFVATSVAGAKLVAMANMMRVHGPGDPVVTVNILVAPGLVALK